MSLVKYYPVGNGDQSLIQVEENGYTTNLMVDCRIRKQSLGSEDSTMYDVKADLLRTLNSKSVNGIAKVPYTDVFILTHGDEDHLLGFGQHFYQGAPGDFKEKHKEAGEIFIDTLWFSPMIMGTATNDDEKVFNKEAKRRIKLHQEKSSDKDLAGNRIAIIGYDGNEKLDGLDLVRYVPGNIVTRLNNRNFNTFSIFIHSPYQQGLTDEEVDKNRVSLVFQARFKAQAGSRDFCSLFMFGGDANHEAFKEIIAKTEAHGNHTREQALSWDVFMAPHHCSWTFFNDCPQEDHPDPMPAPLKFLKYKRSDQAIIVASCKEIKNDDDNPPHDAARERYIKEVGKANFLNTATAILSGKTPQPIIYEVTAGGPMKPKIKEGTATVVGSGSLSSVTQPKGYGSGFVQ